MWRENRCLAGHGGQPQRGEGTCLGLEWCEGLPGVEKEPVEGVPSPAFPGRPAWRLSLKAGWEGPLHGATLGHWMHMAIGTLQSYHGKDGFWSLEQLHFAAWARVSLCLFVHGISSFAEWSRIVRQVLGQKVRTSFKKYACFLKKWILFRSDYVLYPSFCWAKVLELHLCYRILRIQSLKWPFKSCNYWMERWCQETGKSYPGGHDRTRARVQQLSM